MKIIVSKDAEMLGREAAKDAALELNKAIKKQGYARLLLSTGASQFETIDSLTKMDVDWSKVEMFHLDEYINLPESHIASFRKYLKERFLAHVNVKNAFLVDGEADVDKTIADLTQNLREKPIDVALIGIGVNGHIAFNDPPADFDTKEAYLRVKLDDKCKMQQVGEGWFDGINDVPNEAISMSVYQIMQSKLIISCVPHEAKADAVADTFANKLTNMVPSTMLKQHENWSLYVDNNSAAKLIN